MAATSLRLALLSTLLFYPSSTMGTLELKDRGCANDSIEHYSSISYRTVNASGSVESPGINLGPYASRASWSWSTGVQRHSNGHVYRGIWVDTKGTNLVAPDLGYEICFMSLDGYSQAVEIGGQGDQGDCTTLFSQTCVKDWKKAIDLSAGTFRPSNSTTSVAYPCPAIVPPLPDSCKNFKNRVRTAGHIPLLKRNCSFGLGDPDYDLITEEIQDTGLKAGSSPSDLNIYDWMVSEIVPFFVVAWTPGINSPRLVESRIMCLSTPNVTEGSRKPPGVPDNAGYRKLFLWDMFIISVLGALWLTF